MSLINTRQLRQISSTNSTSSSSTSVDLFTSSKIIYVTKDALATDTRGSYSKYDFFKPFATLAAAKTAAASGDVIYVGPGSYTVTDSILKNGVNWHFVVGAIVTFTNPASEYGLLDDNGAAITTRISGYGDFIREESSNTVSGIHARVVGVKHADTNVFIQAREIKFLSTATTSSAYCLWQESGVMHVEAKRMFANGYTGIIIGWLNGPGFVRCDEMICNAAAVYFQCDATPTGDLYIDAQFIDVTLGGTSQPSYAIWNNGTDTTAGVWIRCAVLKGTAATSTSRSILCSAGSGNKVYVTAQKIWGNAQIDGSGITYITADKWTATQNGGVSQALFYKSSGSGLTFLSVKHYDPSTFTGHAWRAASGTVQIIDGTYIAASGGGILCASSAVIKLRGMSIDTTANSAVSAVTVSGGTCTLIASELLAHASGVDIGQSGGTAQVAGGYGSGTNGNFRTSGTVGVLVPI
jgi:hypothetical protein